MRLLKFTAVIILTVAIGTAIVGNASHGTATATPSAAAPIPHWQQVALTRISRMNNCTALFHQWDRAIDRANNQDAGKWHDVSVSYADAATKRMDQLGC